jgi:hypothetical protein
MWISSVGSRRSLEAPGGVPRGGQVRRQRHLAGVRQKLMEGSHGAGWVGIGASRFSPLNGGIGG